jgi:hypothetical protein
VPGKNFENQNANTALSSRGGLSLAVSILLMAHREFMDGIGRHWDVWSVVPERAERRQRESDDHVLERRDRENHEFRVPLSEPWTHGWLAFETKGEKRRLAPIPDNWDLGTDEQLHRLLDQAGLIAYKPRRLAE